MLVIDEVYSLSAELFRFVAILAQKLKEMNGRFFLFCVGDFMQLPPVSCKLPERVGEPVAVGDLVQPLFQGEEWQNFPTLLLTDIVRQGPSDELARFANLGWKLDPTEDELGEVVRIIQGLARSHQRHTDEEVLFCACTNKQVDNHNKAAEAKLRATHAAEWTYLATDGGDPAYLSGCPLLPAATFIVGMFVMLVVNLDPLLHLVNGTTGVVTAVDANSITVSFHGGRLSRRFERYQFKVVDWVDDKTVLASRLQVPFVPAHALTVHKQQGSTVRERVCMDLTQMGRPGDKRGWTDADRRAFLYVACTRPVCESLLVLKLTQAQSSDAGLRRILEAGLAEMRAFVTVLRANDILARHT
jgi:ATP-dependent exoDNAse (exonuclease V) alpha subunit